MCVCVKNLVAYDVIFFALIVNDGMVFKSMHGAGGDKKSSNNAHRRAKITGSRLRKQLIYCRHKLFNQVHSLKSIIKYSMFYGPHTLVCLRSIVIIIAIPIKSR